MKSPNSPVPEPGAPTHKGPTAATKSSGPLMVADLLRLRAVRALVTPAAFPVALQVMALVGVVCLAAVGWGYGLDLDPSELKLLRKTNLATLAVWGLWWPAMIVGAVLLGRVWCTVCPLELVNRIGDAMARALGWRRARLGKLLRAGWATLGVYFLMQLLVAGFDLHRFPHLTAVMLMVLVGAALAAGLVFSHPRAFCVAFCPASALLSVYGRLSPLQLSHRDDDVCAACTTRDCVRAENRYRLDERSCPSLIRPFAREPSDGCVLCMQCAKVCPHDNIGFGVVEPTAAVRRRSLLRPFEAMFVMIALGFVTHEVVGELYWLDHHFHAAPELLHAALPSLSFSWIEAAWFLILFPLGGWTLIGASGALLGHRRDWRWLLLACATGAAPVVAVAHLAKAAAKLSSWAPFVPGALADPTGLATFEAIVAGHIAAPTSLLGLPVVGWVALILVVWVAVQALRWSRQMPAEARVAARSGTVLSALLFGTVLALWAIPWW